MFLLNLACFGNRIKKDESDVYSCEMLKILCVGCCDHRVSKVLQISDIMLFL